ncbi:MAG: hypothetical protein AAB600_02435 [Patescibacteria group bacterium]
MEQQNQQPIQEKIQSKPPIKTNWKFIAIVAIVATTLVVGGILLLRTQQLPPPSPQPQTLDTPIPALSPSTPLGINSVEGWQTYRNGKFGFEVKYPEGWKAQTQTNLVRFEKQGGSYVAVEISLRYEKDFLGVYFALKDQGPGSTFTDRFGVQYTKVENVEIAGIPAIRYTANLLSGIPNVPPFIFNERVMFMKKRPVLTFVLKTDNIAKQEDVDTFNQILSTFRFTP